LTTKETQPVKPRNGPKQKEMRLSNNTTYEQKKEREFGIFTVAYGKKQGLSRDVQNIRPMPKPGVSGTSLLCCEPAWEINKPKR